MGDGNNEDLLSSVGMWSGLARYFIDEVFGPFFTMHFDLVTVLIELFPNGNKSDIPRETLFFQQDGAPLHFARPRLH